MDSSDTLPDSEDLAASGEYNPPETCVLCNNEEHNRHAWGLIIHPAQNAGEYYRVGIFT